MPRNHALAAVLKPNASNSALERLSEPQRYIIEEFQKCGLTMASVAATLLEVMSNSEAPAAQVSAADLMIRATIGFAPTKSASLNIHKTDKQDKFFSEETFEKLPPTATD